MLQEHIVKCTVSLYDTLFHRIDCRKVSERHAGNNRRHPPACIWAAKGSEKRKKTIKLTFFNKIHCFEVNPD